MGLLTNASAQTLSETLTVNGATFFNGNATITGGGWASMTPVTGLPAGGQVRMGNGRLVADHEVWGRSGLGMTQYAMLNGGLVTDVNAWSMGRATNQIHIMQTNGTAWSPVLRIGRFPNEITSIGAAEVGVLGGTIIATRAVIRGDISAKEVRVTANPADYVFASDYKLESLSSVEKFINENKHLKGMPSADSQLKAGSVSLGELQRIHLEKIEELTLYAIQANKEIGSQKETIEALSARLEKLEALMKK